MPNNSVKVKFYSLYNFPNPQNYNQTQDGSFLYLTQDDATYGKLKGLYFGDGGWKYLCDVSIKSAGVVNGVAYFFNTSTIPTQQGTSDIDTTQAVFSFNLPSSPAAGGGIDLTSNTYSIDLAATTVTGNTTTPHTGSTNLLKIDTNDQLSISDTWDCGEYDSQIYRHVQHLKTSNLQYVNISKYSIPDGATVTQESSVPQNPTSSSPEYIQLSGGNHWYYRLVGKEPLPLSLQYGEIAVSYAEGYERLYIKNSNDDIIEFEPANRNKNLVSNATFLNGALTPSHDICKWTIPYTELADAGISSEAAMVFVREISTGKQLVPDVVFNDSDSQVEIYIYSTSNISANQYTAVVIGSNYNNSI